MFRLCMTALMLLVFCLSAHAQVRDEVTRPSLLRSPTEYPSSAVAAREQGTVRVKALVDANGHVTDAVVDQSSGHAALDEAAVRSVSQWSFTPGTRNGKAEAGWVRLPVAFELKELAGDAVGAPGNRPFIGQSLRLIAAYVFAYLALTIWLVAFFWSWVLAKRQSILWLSGMVAMWILAYPCFVATHWAESKRNLIVVVLSAALFGASAYLLHSQPLPT